MLQRVACFLVKVAHVGLTLIAVAGLHLREITGCCVIVLLTLAPIHLVALIFFQS